MDWPMARRVERLAVRMHEVMERLGVDPLKLIRRDGGDSYDRARRTCLTCGTSDKCLRWIDGTGRADRPPAFCPNLPLFEACRRDPEEQGRETK